MLTRRCGRPKRGDLTGEGLVDAEEDHGPEADRHGEVLRLGGAAPRVGVDPELVDLREQHPNGSLLTRPIK